MSADSSESLATVVLRSLANAAEQLGGSLSKTLPDGRTVTVVVFHPDVREGER